MKKKTQEINIPSTHSSRENAHKLCLALIDCGFAVKMKVKTAQVNTWLVIEYGEDIIN